MSLGPYPAPVHVAGAAGPPGRTDADVIILALDRAEDTIAAIASARAQTGLAKHVWVADQGSKPENLALLAAAVGDAPDATLVRLDRNWGVAGGRNRATALGTGRCVFALDNDAEFATADTLARAVEALDDEPDIAAVACRIQVFATGAEDLSSWGYPPRCCRAPPGPSTQSPSSAPAMGSAEPISRPPAATTTPCSSAGRSSTSPCGPSMPASASATAATSRCGTRSAASTASPGPAPAGSTSSATGSISG
ncbi:glycosyltransferase family 2 protein [Paeniroseomonas aquatica]|uniref:glycosyltransferase family 2 protein n=1 Tax=Paeniroseomonas aquatica TaxID=373043 RepID=UPI0036217665